MKQDIAHVRLLPADRRPLDELQSRFSESGIQLTDSDLIRLAIRRLPVDPAALFGLPMEARR